jgi:hypothetical protein
MMRIVNCTKSNEWSRHRIGGCSEWSLVGLIGATKRLGLQYPRNWSWKRRLDLMANSRLRVIRWRSEVLTYELISVRERDLSDAT